MDMIYLDNSATTPLSKEVLEEMEPYFDEEFGNPSTLYRLGQRSKEAVEEARRRVAESINAKPEEIIFTSGGTESDNLAIKGIAFRDKDDGKHIITSEIEHPAVRESLHFLESLGFDVTYLPVYEDGIVKVEDVEDAICDDTILITIMHANNEIGTVQPIAEIGEIARRNDIKFHCDAVQSFGKIPVDVEKLGVNLLSLSSHKVYGPKGVGALYVKKGTRLEPQMHGGGQERGIRSGTENVPGIVGFGRAAQLAFENLDENYDYLIGIRDSLIDKVLENVPYSYLNGSRYDRLPNIVNFRFAAIEGESLILLLDAKGINSSTGSACSSKTLKASPILKALGLDDVDVHGSLRLSIGMENSLDDVDFVVDSIENAVNTLRKMSPLWNSDECYDDMMCRNDKDYCKKN